MNIVELKKAVLNGKLRKKRMGDVRSDTIKEFEYVELFQVIASELHQEGKKEFLISACNRLNTAVLVHEATYGLKQKGIEIFDMSIGNTTPITEKTRKYLGVSGAMITASHQPPKYNCVKLEWM